MKVYKGTDKDMKCRGFQYELGVTVNSDDAIRCGNKGFHSCEAPFDVLRYYPNKNGNRFFEATADGKIDRTGANDSKIASSEITLDAEISFDELRMAQIEYTRAKAEPGECGDGSNLAGGNWSNLAGGDSSNLAGGDWSLVVGRNGCSAKAGMNSVIVLTEWKITNCKYTPVSVKAAIVDGIHIKADTWYRLVDGEFTEVE